MFASVAASAQTISIADTHIHHCGHDHDSDHDRDDLVCNERKAFSLAAFESGLIHLPVDGHAHREFVMVNDTGASVKLLQFSYFGTLDDEDHVRCRMDGLTHKVFQSCSVTGAPADEDAAKGPEKDHGDDRDDHGRPDSDDDKVDHDGDMVAASPEFSFLSGTRQSGIPAGAYFDIRAEGFRQHHDADHGYLSGTAVATVSSNCVGTAATFTPTSTSGFAPAMATTSLTVNQGSQTVLTATRNADPNNPVILTVTVTTVPGDAPATGSITIYDTTNWVQAAVQLTNGQASWAVPVSLTSLTIYAVYSGDSSTAGSTSAPMVGPEEMAVLYPSN